MHMYLNLIFSSNLNESLGNYNLKIYDRKIRVISETSPIVLVGFRRLIENSDYHRERILPLNVSEENKHFPKHGWMY